ncbi:MAG: TetR/AcrR family transcriptional regulator [Arenicella sp.]
MMGEVFAIVNHLFYRMFGNVGKTRKADNMGRQVLVSDNDLTQKLTQVFRESGFDGTSLAALAEASGLKKASLYHRFPGGKEQMASEVLSATGHSLSERMSLILQGDDTPHQRVDMVAQMLNEFYSEGNQACLLNVLSSSHVSQGAIEAEIKLIFQTLIAGIQQLIEDAGFEAELAHMRAQRAVMLLQGSLVLSRGMGSTRPFKDFLKTLPDELLG